LRLRRVIGVIGLGLAFAWLPPAALAGAATPEGGTASTSSSAQPAPKKSGFRSWISEHLDPRKPFRHDPPAPQPAPAPEAKKKPAARKPAARRPAAAANATPKAVPDAPVAVAPSAPPSPADAAAMPPPVVQPVEPAPPSPVAPTPIAPTSVAEPTTSSHWLPWVAIALSVAALAAQLSMRRRRQPPPPPAPVAAPVLPPTIVQPLAPIAPTVQFRDTAATLASASVDAAVTAALETAGTLPNAFPGGGRYEILEEIGRGGMGVVYKARDKRLDRIVALKRLPDTLDNDPNAVALLLREARSAARLNHRNITTIYDIDRENGSWFITMELLEGDLLATTLRKQGPIAPHEVLSIGEQVAAGLGYAHERGIVHRDVKPANLFVTRDSTLKLMDFGVAKIVEEARKKRTMVGGTPSYMSPEQSLGEAVDGRSDLYALGATLFELLTGAVPFAQGDPLYHHRATQPSDPRERAPHIPDRLAELVLALLRKRPEERPASADAVAEELRSIAAATLPRAGSQTP
jgi:tRNA A-37 threonylcarbamoyl transferase component Bud32